MDDQQTWAQAVESTGRHYDLLPTRVKGELDALINEIMGLKKQLSELTLSAGGVDICRICGGKCCLNGKYHVSMLDLLAYRNSTVAPVVPDFTSHPHCPYSGESGCLMQPCFRPMTCVVFNCELIEDRMKPHQSEAFYECEKLLRLAIRQACLITGSRLDRALLLSWQQVGKYVGNSHLRGS